MNRTRPCSVFPGIALVFIGLLAFGPNDTASAATIAVTNCHDKGIGSLRNAVRLVVDGDTIDLRSPQCRRILLTSGAIVVPQTTLNLVGRGPRKLTIDGNQLDRVIRHTGTGTLQVSYLSIANGRIAALDATGGCVNSEGSVDLRWARVHHCYAGALDSYTTGTYALGGGWNIRPRKRRFVPCERFRQSNEYSRRG